MIRKLLNRIELYFVNRRRFECSREKTGQARGVVYHYGLWKRFVMYEEYNVLTNLPSHDITDEYHLEWVKTLDHWQWSWT